MCILCKTKYETKFEGIFLYSYKRKKHRTSVIDILFITSTDLDLHTCYQVLCDLQKALALGLSFKKLFALRVKREYKC